MYLRRAHIYVHAPVSYIYLYILYICISIGPTSVVVAEQPTSVWWNVRVPGCRSQRLRVFFLIDAFRPAYWNLSGAGFSKDWRASGFEDTLSGPFKHTSQMVNALHTHPKNLRASRSRKIRQRSFPMFTRFRTGMSAIRNQKPETPRLQEQVHNTVDDVNPARPYMCHTRIPGVLEIMQGSIV